MNIGVLGGTFDPIHEGHLAVADAACETLGLARVLVIPSHHPPHRRTEPRASGYHRFAMTALALLSRAARPQYVASDLELLATDRSYTSTTLRRLHAGGFDASQLFFITGADAFAEIATWNDYPAILDLAHFAVVSRPGHPASHLPTLLPDLAGRMINCGAPASGATTAGARKRDDWASFPRIWLIERATPAVSSTEIRRRLQAGDPVAGMLAPGVEAYIRRHGLYGAACDDTLR